MRIVSYIHPALREQWENVPIYIKNRILEANVTIETAEELQTCVALIEKQEQCCGDVWQKPACAVRIRRILTAPKATAKPTFPRTRWHLFRKFKVKPKPPRKKPNPSPKNKRNEQGKHPARFTYSEIVHFTFAVFFVLVQLTDTFARYTKSIPRGNR